MRNIHYRTSRATDIDDLAGLMLQLGYTLDRGELSTNIRAITKSGGEVIVAESDGSVVGCITVLIDARLAEGIYAEIVSLVVSESSRGHGIGKQLVQRAEAWASGRVAKIRVRANEVRDSAHSFYRSLGYLEVKTQKVFRKGIGRESS